MGHGDDVDDEIEDMDDDDDDGGIFQPMHMHMHMRSTKDAHTHTRTHKRPSHPNADTPTEPVQLSSQDQQIIDYLKDSKRQTNGSSLGTMRVLIRNQDGKPSMTESTLRCITQNST